MSSAPGRTVIFDLDGTLLDSLRDVAEAANHAMRSLDQPTHAIESYRTMVGDGADVLMTRALPDDRRNLAEEALRRFKRYYAEHMLDHTRLYEGVAELLDELNRRGVPIAVLSNKPHEATLRVVSKLLGRWRWAAVAGHRPDVPRKPDPTAALRMAERMDAPPARCLFIGDSDIDMRTAMAAGMPGIGAVWGFRGRDELIRHGAAALIDHPRELLRLIDDTSDIPIPEHR